MAFTFEFKGVDGFEKKLQEYPEKVGEAVQEQLVDAVTEINAIQVQNASRFTDRGEILRGIGWEPAGPLNYRLFSQAPYSAAMEFGTRTKFQPISGVDASPYKGPWNMRIGKTLFQSILEWVKRKGIAYGTTFSVKTRRKRGGRKQDAAERQAAFAISRHIAKYGVKPQPFFFAPFLSRRQQILQDVQKAINNIR